MKSVKFLDDHNAGVVEYKKDDIIKLDNYVAEQLQSHNVIEILSDSPKKKADDKNEAAEKKTVEKKKPVSTKKKTAKKTPAKTAKKKEEEK